MPPKEKIQPKPKTSPPVKRKPRKPRPSQGIAQQKNLLKDAICKVLDYCELEKRRCQLTVPLTHPYSRVAAMFQLSLSSIERTRRKQRQGFEYVPAKKPKAKKKPKPTTVAALDHFAMANSLYKNQFDFDANNYTMDKGHDFSGLKRLDISVPGVSGANKGPQQGMPVNLKESGSKMVDPGPAKIDYERYQQQRHGDNIYHNMRVPDFM